MLNDQALAALRTTSNSDLATQFAKCPCASGNCDSCRPVFAMLKEKGYCYLLQKIEGLPAGRRHAPPYGGMCAGPIADRTWEWFREHRGEWLTAITQARKPRSFSGWLGGYCRKKIMDEFVSEPTRRGKKQDLTAANGRMTKTGRVAADDSDGQRDKLIEDVEDTAELVEAAQQIIAISKNVLPVTQTAVRLVFEHGCTLDQAAAITGVPKTTLISRFNSLGNLFAKGRSWDSGPIAYLVNHRRGRKAA